MIDKPDRPPLPLGLTDAELLEIREWVARRAAGESCPNERLTAELVALLRRIDDKLQWILDRMHEAR